MTAYLVFREGEEVASVPGTTRGYRDLGLAASTLYRYTVKARTSRAISAPPPTRPRPPRPTNSHPMG
ncbi:hypothetical protein ACN28S_22405 [Cystobacter fuscus]